MATIEVTVEESTTTFVDVWKGTQGDTGPIGNTGSTGAIGPQGEGLGNLDGGLANSLYTGDPIDGGDATPF